MNKKIKAFIPTVKREAAKQFYQEIMGLKLLSEDPYGIEFDSDGTTLRITPVQSFTPHPFTVLGWDVKDIIAGVKSLEAKGVKLEIYGFLEQDASGIWTAPGGTKVAWFKDPDGNLLSLSELA